MIELRFLFNVFIVGAALILFIHELANALKNEKKDEKTYGGIIQKIDQLQKEKHNG